MTKLPERLPVLARFLDHLWLEYGLSANTLAAYGADLRILHARTERAARTLERATEIDLLDFLSDSAQLSARTAARRRASTPAH